MMTALQGTQTGGTYAGYDLEHLSVLIVDASQASRELMASTLKDIGVGSVRKVSNGLQAIEYLKDAKARFGTPANPPVDLILTDIDTHPVDGFMLARWVRRHADSPNHFMRVMIISGALNMENIRAGRNMGVSDFIAKPFTFNSLRDRIYSAIHNFRPFVLVSTYFGPDRRRHLVAPKAQDRRTHMDPIDESRTPKVKSEEDLKDEAAGVRVFSIPNYLEAIVTGTSMDNLNFSALKKAEAERSAWVQDYADWTLPQVAFMESELAAAEAAAKGSDEVGRTRALESIRREALTMENTGLYLGYPLVSAVAKSLGRALDLFGVPWETQSALIKSHVQTLFLIARDRIADDQSELGLKIMESLKGIPKKPSPSGAEAG